MERQRRPDATDAGSYQEKTRAEKWTGFLIIYGGHSADRRDPASASASFTCERTKGRSTHETSGCRPSQFDGADVLQ